MCIDLGRARGNPFVPSDVACYVRRMKTLNKIVAVAFLLALPSAHAAPAFAAFGSLAPYVPSDVFGSARDAAMAHADLTRDDAGSLWTNPGATLDPNHLLALDVAYAPSYRDDDTWTGTAAVALTKGPFRLAVGLRREDSALVERTVFEPDGTGRVGYERDTVAIGIALEPTHWIDDAESITWTVGATGRTRSDGALNPDPTPRPGSDEGRPDPSDESIDLGTSLAWSPGSGARVRSLSLGVVLENVNAAKLEVDATTTRRLGRALRVGTTLTAALTDDGTLVGTLAGAFTHELGDLDDADAWHVGAELIVFDRVCVRAGRHDWGLLDVASFGAALRLPVSERLEIEASWTLENPLDDPQDVSTDATSIFGLRTTLRP